MRFWRILAAIRSSISRMSGTRLDSSGRAREIWLPHGPFREPTRVTTSASRAGPQQILEVPGALRRRLAGVGNEVQTVAIDHRIEPVSLEDIERFIGIDILSPDVGGEGSRHRAEACGDNFALTIVNAPVPKFFDVA